MQGQTGVNPPDQNLALWAASCLSCSAIFGVGVVALWALTSSPATMVKAHPLGVISVLIASVAWAVSFVTLSRLRRATTGSRRRLWYRSLACGVLVVGVSVGFFGAIGFVIGGAEVMALILHIVALSKLGVEG
jgi:hypothetical protein